MVLDMKGLLEKGKWREAALNSTVMETDMLVVSEITSSMELVFGIVLPTRPRDRVNGKMVRE